MVDRWSIMMGIDIQKLTISTLVTNMFDSTKDRGIQSGTPYLANLLYNYRLTTSYGGYHHS